MANIPQGYVIKVTTWENDGDNYMTVEKSGLSATDVKFYIMICNMFRAEYDTAYQPVIGRRLGNGEIQEIDINAVLDAAVNHFRDQIGPIPHDWDKKLIAESAVHVGDDFYADLVYDLIGNWMEGTYYRVVEGYQVFYVPVELVDSTKEF